MWLPWPPALALAAVVASFVFATRTSPGKVVAVARGLAREVALVLALYALWRYAGGISVMKVDHAIDRGRALWDLEQWLHLPSELEVQRWILPHPLMVQAFNRYYAVIHVPAIIAVLVWAFVFHRDRYPLLRNTLALVTGACLVVQLVPVAPPRMFPGLGFVDTAQLYGQSVYGAVGTGISDQLSAMPSVHVAWAVLVALAAVLFGSSRWRWAVVAHPILTVAAVTVTANHWWLDGVVAVGLLLMSAAVHLALSSRRGPCRREVVVVSSWTDVQNTVRRR